MKERILLLREQGKTYNEIQQILGCSKSTISYYCSPGRKDRQKDYQNSLRREKRKQLRIYIRRVKSYLGCIDCNNKDWRVLDFDHVRGIKIFQISAVHRFNYGLTELKQEMRKCDVRCSNCHRIKTYEERQVEEL